MANIPTAKTLIKAIPTILSDNRHVQTWNAVVELTSTDPSIDPPVVREYPYTWDVSALEKTPEQFTKDEVIAAAPTNLDDVFTSQYESTQNVTPTENLPDWSFGD